MNLSVPMGAAPTPEQIEFIQSLLAEMPEDFDECSCKLSAIFVIGFESRECLEAVLKILKSLGYGTRQIDITPARVRNWWTYRCDKPAFREVKWIMQSLRELHGDSAK